MASYTNALPESYSRTWLRTARGYWNGTEGDLATPLRAMVRARWGRVPPCLFAGFIANARRTEDTGQPNGQDLPNPRFREIGWFGTEAGLTFEGPTANACMQWWLTPAARRTAPAPACTFTRSPNASVRAPYNHWGMLADDPRVRRLLGRAAALGHLAWTQPAGIPDQVAVGLTNLGDHGDAVNNRLPGAVRARDPQSAWFWFLAFIGWSAGDGRATNHVARFAADPALAAAPENLRLGTLLRLAAEQALRNPGVVGTPKSHANPFYTFSRGLQKRKVGADLAIETGSDPNWFALGLPNEAQLLDVIVRAGYGAPIAGAPRPAGNLGASDDVGEISARRADLASDYLSVTPREPPSIFTRITRYFYG